MTLQLEGNLTALHAPVLTASGKTAALVTHATPPAPRAAALQQQTAIPVIPETEGRLTSAPALVTVLMVTMLMAGHVTVSYV